MLHPSVCSAGLPRAFVAASARAAMASTCPGPRVRCGSRRVRGSAKARLRTDRVGTSDGRVGTRVRVSASRTLETSLGALESTLRPRLLHALHHRMPPVSQGRPRCERRPRRSRGVRCAWKRWGRCGRRRRPQFGAAGRHGLAAWERRVVRTEHWGVEDRTAQRGCLAGRETHVHVERSQCD